MSAKLGTMKARMRRREDTGKRHRILIVDDDPLTRAALARSLDDEFTLVQADGGTAALTLLAGDDAFDLIICDVNMGAVGGLDLFQVLRGRAPALADKLILISGSLDPDDLDPIAKWSIPFLPRPIDRRALRAAVAGAIERAAQGDKRP
jgi:CheY-like chemotaxis protein